MSGRRYSRAALPLTPPLSLSIYLSRLEHKRNYNERRWVGWKVLVEIAIVSAIVMGISALSVIVAQRASQRVQLSYPQPSPDL